MSFKRSNLSVKISFRVTEEENEILKAKAASEGHEVVDVIRNALDAYFTSGASRPAMTGPQPVPKDRRKK